MASQIKIQSTPKKIEKSIEKEKKADGGAFQRSTRTPRSPTYPVGLTRSPELIRSPEHLGSEEPIQTEADPEDQPVAHLAMERDEAITRCKAVLKKMKEAANRQKNMSTDVKIGLVEMEVLLEVITRDTFRGKTTKSAKEGARVSTPSSSSKRPASSPAEEIQEDKRQRSDGASWAIVVSRRTKRKERGRQEEEQPALSDPVAQKIPPPAGAQTGAPNRETPARTAAPGALKEKEKKRRRRRRPDAILIKPAEGKTYADVLGTIRRDVDPAVQGWR